MMKNLSKITIKILFIIFIILLICVPVSEATSWGGIFNSGDEFLELGKEEQQYGEAIDSYRLSLIIDNLYNLLFALGIVISVIVGAVIGIKLMFGGIDEKAKTKELLIPYVAGCVVVFGAFGIWKFVMIVMSNIS